MSKLGYKPDMKAISKETIHISNLSRSAHKGERGSILCLGGSKSMEGAGILADIRLAFWWWQNILGIKHRQIAKTT